MNSFDAASPFDSRYYFADAGFYERLHPFISEGAQVQYLARVEAALAETLADYGVCSARLAAEIGEACHAITPQEVYEEESRIQHNIRAWSIAFAGASAPPPGLTCTSSRLPPTSWIPPGPCV